MTRRVVNGLHFKVLLAHMDWDYFPELDICVNYLMIKLNLLDPFKFRKDSILRIAADF